MYDAIVIGGGHNGLTGAAYLARAGLSTLVLERRDQVGGACVTEEIWPGCRVATGAYLCSLLHPRIIQELELSRYGLELLPRSPTGFSPAPDGRALLLHPGREAQDIAGFCRDAPRDAAGFEALEREVDLAAKLLDPWLLTRPPAPEEVQDAFRSAGAANLYGSLIEGSVQDLMDRHLSDGHLKAVLATDGLIGGGGGPRSPGTAYCYLHHCMGRALGSRGAWGYARGGMGSISRAIAAAARDAGCDIRTDARVERVLVDQREPRRADGVALASGEEIRARVVLSNADPFETFERLAKETPVEGVPPWQGLKRRGGAAAKINLLVSDLPRFRGQPILPGPGPEHAGTIHIVPAMEALQAGWELAAQGYPSTEPMIEMTIQSAWDASLAPAGKFLLSLFVQYFPYNLAPGLRLERERESFTRRVIDTLAGVAPNVPAVVEASLTLTPRDLEERFGLTGGHIFHGDLMPPNLWSHRPGGGVHGARTPLRGLYLCGSGAHPGGCVSGAPGYNAAAAVMEDLRAEARG